MDDRAAHVIPHSHVIMLFQAFPILSSVTIKLLKIVFKSKGNLNHIFFHSNNRVRADERAFKNEAWKHFGNGIHCLVGLKIYQETFRISRF
jgi:hypothetical protein